MYKQIRWISKIDQSRLMCCWNLLLPSYQILYPTISKNPRPNVQSHSLHDFSWCRPSLEVHEEFLRVGCCSNCLGILRSTLAASIAAFPPFWCSGVRRFNNSIRARSETIFSLLESEPTKTLNSVMAGVLKARELVQALVELQRDEESTDFLRSLEDSQRRNLAFSSFRLTGGIYSTVFALSQPQQMFPKNWYRVQNTN